MAKRGRKPKKSDESADFTISQSDRDTISQSDRIIRTNLKKTFLEFACPECGAFPTVCRLKRKNYELRYCRVCRHRFEIGGN